MPNKVNSFTTRLKSECVRILRPTWYTPVALVAAPVAADFFAAGRGWPHGAFDLQPLVAASAMLALGLFLNRRHNINTGKYRADISEEGSRIRYFKGQQAKYEKATLLYKYERYSDEKRAAGLLPDPMEFLETLEGEEQDTDGPSVDG